MISSKQDIINPSKYFSDFLKTKSPSKTIDNPQTQAGESNVKTKTPLNTDTFDKSQKIKNNDNDNRNNIWYYIGGAVALGILGYIFRKPIAKLFKRHSSSVPASTKPIERTTLPKENPVDIPVSPTKKTIEEPTTPPIKTNSPNRKPAPQINSTDTQGIVNQSKVTPLITSDVETTIDKIIDNLMEILKIDKSKKALIKAISAKVIEFNCSPVITNDILKSVTEKNKDTIITAIPAIAKYADVLDIEPMIPTLLKVLTKDNATCLEELGKNASKLKIHGYEDVYRLLRHLTKDNKDFAFNELFPTLLKDSEKYMIRSSYDITEYLSVVTPQNKDFAFKELFPALLKDVDKYLINSSSDLTRYVNVITPHNKDFVFKELLPVLLKDTEKYMIKYNDDLTKYLSVVTPQNKDFVFKELLPVLLKDTEKYMIRSSYDIAEYLKVITPQNKDFVFNELLPVLLKDTGKYMINRSYDLTEYSKVITPENKDFMLNEVIPLITKLKNKLYFSKMINIVPCLTKDNYKGFIKMLNSQKNLSDYYKGLNFDKSKFIREIKEYM